MRLMAIYMAADYENEELEQFRCRKWHRRPLFTLRYTWLDLGMLRLLILALLALKSPFGAGIYS